VSTPRTVVVTGANSGVGFETASALVGLGDRVVICCRNRAKGEAALDELRRRSPQGDVELVDLDLADFASIRSAADTLVGVAPTIDVLINNAGLILTTGRTTTAQGLETTFGVNHVGHFLLTSLLEQQIRSAPEPRVINVASVAHHWEVGGLDFDDLQVERHHYFGWLTYARSKLANIHFTQELARRWPDVAVNSLHPGTVASGFGHDGDTGGISHLLMRAAPIVAVDAAAGAATSVFLATADEGRRITGRYWVRRKVGHTSRWARSRESDERLWEASERIVAAHPAT
jgi:NAD(P)-dependent dehydrogenase (short-subunit alcohol dehydrogenase family)